MDGIPDGVAFSHNADSLRGLNLLNVVTRSGEMDVAISPSGVGGFVRPQGELGSSGQPA